MVVFYFNNHFNVFCYWCSVIVTAGFFENLFGIDYLGEWTIIILFVVCVVILAIGKYNALDSLIKIVAIVLVMSTVTAFILVLYDGPIEPVDGFITKDLITVFGIFFLLALLRWMPAPLEISSWNSCVDIRVN